jgi:hypothetical protein
MGPASTFEYLQEIVVRCIAEEYFKGWFVLGNRGRKSIDEERSCEKSLFPVLEGHGSCC